MILSAQDLSKRFYNELIFRRLNYTFSSNDSYAIIGPNGSGKSTFLKVLAGITPPSKGKIEYKDEEENIIDPDHWYKHLVFVSPYMDLIEEFTLKEFLTFHSKFKTRLEGVTIADIADSAFLSKSINKPIKNFSSGMKQRLKLTLAFFFKSDLVFLDEPTSNLDEQGIEWYVSNINKLAKERLLFIASNQLIEYKTCSQRLNILDYKE